MNGARLMLGPGSSVPASECHASTRPWITECPQWHQPVNLTGRHASKCGASSPNTQTLWPAESFSLSPLGVRASTHDTHKSVALVGVGYFFRIYAKPISILIQTLTHCSLSTGEVRTHCSFKYQNYSISFYISCCIFKALDIFLIYIVEESFSYRLTCTAPPFQLIQKLRNSSQERIPGVAALTSGSPILPKEIQERVFCRPPSTISSISALSCGLAERAKWASLWVFTATWNWFILAGFFTYWYSYLLGVEMWILSDNENIKYLQTLGFSEVCVLVWTLCINLKKNVYII